MAEAGIVDEIVKRLSAHEGVEGILILNGDGIIVRSTLEAQLSTQYAGWISFLVAKSRSAVEKFDRTHPQDELTTLRVRSKQHEIIIVPELQNGHEYILVAVHKAAAQ